jgi:hypothetical protein
MAKAFRCDSSGVESCAFVYREVSEAAPAGTPGATLTSCFAIPRPGGLRPSPTFCGRAGLPDSRCGTRARIAICQRGSWNWQLSGIVTLQSGSPFTIVSSNSAVASAGTANGEQIAPIVIANGRSAEVEQYFNTSAVTQAPAGTYGNLGRNSLVGPGYVNTDASFSRSVRLPLGDAGKLTFRAEAFNLFNRPDLGTPGTKVASSTFGVITATSAAPRIVQFSLKVLF